MILTDFQLEGFRRFTAPVRLAGLKPGLNVLAAPNEAGKSTLLQALRAALTLRYTSKSQPVKDLASYGGSAPHVVLRFTWKARPCVLEKRFLTKTCMRLMIGEDRYEGDEAEEHLRVLLGLEQAGKNDIGLWPALLVGQGESFTQPSLNETGQASIRACLAQGADVVTGGAAASAVLAKVRERLGTLQTATTGKPTGRYKQALEQEAQAQAQLDSLETRKAALEEDIRALDLARRTLREQENPERRLQDEAALASLRSERDGVQQLEAAEKVAKAHAASAETLCETLEQDKRRREENRVRQKDLFQKKEVTRQAQEALLPRVKQAHSYREQATAQREHCEQTHTQARRLRMAAAQQSALRQKQQNLVREQALLKRADAALAQLEQAEATVNAQPVDDGVMKTLLTAERTCEQLQAQCTAQAPKLSFALLPEAAARVRVADAPCPQDALSVLRETRVEVEGIGAFIITPPQQDKAGLFEKWQVAQATLTQLLQQASCQSMAEAATRFEQFKQAQTRVLEERAAFFATLPEGATAQNATQVLADLRKQVAHTEALLAQAERDLAPAQHGVEKDIPLTLDDAATAEEQAATAAEQARHAERTAQSKQDTVQVEYQHTQAALREVEESLAQVLREEAATQARRSDESLVVDLAQVRQTLLVTRAEAEAVAHKRALARPLAVIEAGITRHEHKLDQARQQITELTGDIREREARVRMAEGEGIDEKIAEAGRTVERLGHDRAGYERERAALALLHTTLNTAEQAQIERYLAPLLHTLQPAFRSVFPGASLALNTHFSVQGLTRRQAEDFEKLSDGTREQIAVLVRLGFAELLYSQHGTSLLVLDDALSFSDSQRLERLFDVLTEAASRFQIVVLTCHAESFRQLGGSALTLQPIEALTELR